jgi:flagellar protein FlaG
MAIEPLGSIMTMQAQTYSQGKIDQTSKNVQAQIDIIQPKMFEKKLTTVVETNHSEFNNEYNRNDKNFKNKKVKDDNNRELSEEEKEKIKEVLKQANKVFGNKLAFTYHEGTKRVEIKIIDKETDKVIKEFPPEEALDSIAKRMELYEKSGLLFDEKC